jgi:cytochrome P450
MQQLSPRSYTMGEAPRALPFLGHGLQLRADPLGLLRSLPQHGDLVKIMVGPLPLYVVCHPELAHEMLVNRAKDFVKGGPVMDRVRTVTGGGLVTADGDAHLRQRRLVQPSFHPARIAEYVRIMQEQAVASSADWDSGGAVDLVLAMGNLTADVTLRCLFSEPGDQEVRYGGHHGLPAALNTVIDGMFLRMINPVQALASLPTPSNRHYQEAMAKLHSVVVETIERYRATGEGGGLLKTMMTAVDEGGRPFDDQELHDQSITLLLGGAETTAVLLAWIFHLLEQNPMVMDSLSAELEEQLSGRPVTADDLPRLVVARNIVAEGLRLYPPAWLLTRRAQVDTELGGLAVPAGTDLAYSPYLLNRDGRFFDGPDDFDPDRWLTRDPKERRSAYLPFGAGNRKCIGDLFALTEAQVVVATIAQIWRFKPLPGSPAVRPRARMSLRPDRMMMMPVRQSRQVPAGNE